MNEKVICFVYLVTYTVSTCPVPLMSRDEPSVEVEERKRTLGVEWEKTDHLLSRWRF